MTASLEHAPHRMAPRPDETRFDAWMHDAIGRYLGQLADLIVHRSH
ncbi:hypothetical protein VCH24_55260 [Variovorax boronicumulans]|nr:hypothetical protein VCH24_55260 [Variovorax boronicumulans]